VGQIDQQVVVAQRRLVVDGLQTEVGVGEVEAEGGLEERRVGRRPFRLADEIDRITFEQRTEDQVRVVLAATGPVGVIREQRNTPWGHHPASVDVQQPVVNTAYQGAR
jgi:hypothetical protein